MTLIQDTIALITNAITEPDGPDKLDESAAKLLDSLELDNSEMGGPPLTMGDQDAEQEPCFRSSRSY